MEREVIIAIVNRGFADEVMNAARAEGATGGTVVNARGTGNNEIEKLFGAVIQPEKEMVLILVPKESRSRIMQAVAERTGLDKDGRGICFSLPVESVRGLRE